MMNRGMLIALSVLRCIFRVQVQDLNFNVIKTGSGSSLSKMKGVYIIDNTNELKDIWKEAFNRNNVPLIDFNKEIVIAVFRGSCPALSYGVYVEKLKKWRSQLLFMFITIIQDKTVNNTRLYRILISSLK